MCYLYPNVKYVSFVILKRILDLVVSLRLDSVDMCVSVCCICVKNEYVWGENWTLFLSLYLMYFHWELKGVQKPLKKSAHVSILNHVKMCIVSNKILFSTPPFRRFTVFTRKTIQNSLFSFLFISIMETIYRIGCRCVMENHVFDLDFVFAHFIFSLPPTGHTLFSLHFNVFTSVSSIFIFLTHTHSHSFV